MPMITAQRGLTPVQIEDFPADAKRSCKGSLHLRPLGSKVITDDELAHLKAKHPSVAAALLVVPEKAAPKKKAEAKPAPKAEEPEPEKTEEQPESTTTRRRSRRSSADG